MQHTSAEVSSATLSEFAFEAHLRLLLRPIGFQAMSHLTRVFHLVVELDPGVPASSSRLWVWVVRFPLQLDGEERQANVLQSCVQ